MVTKYTDLINSKKAPATVPEIADSLSKVDAAFRHFSSSSQQFPESIPTTIEPVLDAAAKFSALAGMMKPQNANSPTSIQDTLGGLLQKRKDAYLKATFALLQEMDREASPVHKTAFNIHDTEATHKHLAAQETVSVIGYMDDLNKVAKEYGTAITAPAIQRMDNAHAALASDLSAITKETGLVDQQYRLPAGATQTFIELDKSAFFDSLGGLGKQAPAGEHKLTALLDPKVFNARMNELLHLHMEDTEPYMQQIRMMEAMRDIAVKSGSSAVIKSGGQTRH